VKRLRVFKIFLPNDLIDLIKYVKGNLRNFEWTEDGVVIKCTKSLYIDLDELERDGRQDLIQQLKEREMGIEIDGKYYLATNRRSSISITLSLKEIKAIDREARRRGLTRQEFIRQLLRKELKLE